MKALMVDLQVATNERNDLSNQIIGDESKQDDITGNSDTDTTQGSTSSGKVLPLNIMNSIKNVKMSDIKNAQDLMAVIVKDNNKEDKDKLEQLVEDEQEVAG